MRCLAHILEEACRAACLNAVAEVDFLALGHRRHQRQDNQGATEEVSALTKLIDHRHYYNYIISGLVPNQNINKSNLNC